MSNYKFTFKKDNIFVEFTSEDKTVVERQFQLWVSAADEYAKMKKPQLNQAQETVEPNPAEKTEPVLEPKQQEIVEEKQEAVEVKQSEPKQEKPEIIESPAPIKTINTIQKKQQGVTVETENAAKQVEPDFGAVFDKTLENPTFQPAQNNDQVFLNLVKSKKTTDKFHYLIIAGYYLSEFKKQDKFTLKQINTVLMQNLSEVVDHTKLQEAINQGLIEILPDLTGVAEVAEYRLTTAGEEFFSKRI